MAFGMKVVHGRNRCDSGSADHRARLAGGGSGFVRSSAAGGRKGVSAFEVALLGFMKQSRT